MIYLRLLIIAWCIVTIPLSVSSRNTEQLLYWENISKISKNKILRDSKLDPIVKYYISNDLKISDNKESLHLLDIITSKSTDEIRPLYFHILNDIVLNSDGALSEIIGKYCLTFLITNKLFVINYFIINSKIKTAYAYYIGYEIAYAEQGLSDNQLTYVDIVTALYKGIKSEKYKTILNDFDSIMLKYINEIKVASQ